MNFTFPFNRKELILTAAFSILWQSIDLDEDSKLVKDNQKSLSLALGMLARENQTAAAEFQRTATAFMHLEGRRLLSPKYIEIETPAAKVINSMPAPQRQDNKSKSTRKQLQAIASRFSTFNKSSRPEESRRATVPLANAAQAQSMSPTQRAGSTVSLSSTRSAPVFPMSTPSPGAYLHPSQSNGSQHSNINLDYFPIGDGEQLDTQTSASSSTMLPPRKPAQHLLSPNIASNGGSWDNLLNMNAMGTPGSLNNILDPNNMFYGTASTQPGLGNEWIADPTGWGLPSMDFSSKAPVPQSLLSFSGESMTSGDDLVFSASSNNGSGTSASASNNGSNASESLGVDGMGKNTGHQRMKGQEAYKGITIPIDDMDEFEFAEIEG